ncbi:GNAT family N-acetyltransferase [Mycolicibacter arupensis]|uniref:Acetyltransferase n=1 Tax=Mycolicibacter arupensis TaxID=342002 RepID=A0A0F5MUG3_9MYCO|nr:GNAT family N-acetyltransferase [Mycolicibacter arupensis]KKB98458.1 acetyltransferase [Mycolicibacter arupensis]MCV7275129.1 GNAT family N-acetyltransferase [Mycolicibacter arupensis]OQZ97792.1 GNAT family N-acetyltransferase [Mycolicibacter arupensis]
MNTTDNNIRVRLATDEDWPAVYQNQARIYGTSADTGDIEAWKRRVKLGDILVAEDVSDPEHPFLVGTSLYYRLRLTVPGGAGLDAAWLAMITVAATHQGRGIWQQISAQGFGILQERGYPILCGVPTQPPAYEIMGAGVASYCRQYHVDPRSAELRTPPGSNRAREVTAEGARHLLPELFDRWCAKTHGELTRDAAWWDDFLEDRESQRDAASPLNFVIHPDGFLTYRVMGAPAHAFRPPFGTVVIQDFCPITDEAHTELLATLSGFEIFDNIVIEVPVDDPLPLKLKDQAAATTAGLSDFLWIRIMKVPEVLAARTYSADADLILEVADPLTVAGGRFRLQIRDGMGKCTPEDGPADVRLGLGELGTIYLGAHRAAELHRAHRITELREGALRELDAAFCTERAPHCSTLF